MIRQPSFYSVKMASSSTHQFEPVSANLSNLPPKKITAGKHPKQFTMVLGTKAICGIFQLNTSLNRSLKRERVLVRAKISQSIQM